jgi:hypothetical protein
LVRERARHVSAISASGLEGTEPEIVLESTDEAALPHPEASAEEATPAGAAKGHRDVELPPWSKGRYGSAIGRAVHGVLQVIDLATGEGLDKAVLAQSLAEGVVEQRDLVRVRP